MLEALLTSAVWSLGFLLLLKTALNLGTQMLLDEWTDEYLFCKSEFCEQQLAAQIKLLGISEFTAFRPSPGEIAFQAETKIAGSLSIRKEVALEKTPE